LRLVGKEPAPALATLYFQFGCSILTSPSSPGAHRAECETPLLRLVEDGFADLTNLE
jgi:hypothetical protein